MVPVNYCNFSKKQISKVSSSNKIDHKAYMNFSNRAPDSLVLSSASNIVHNLINKPLQGCFKNKSDAFHDLLGLSTIAQAAHHHPSSLSSPSSLCTDTHPTHTQKRWCNSQHESQLPSSQMMPQQQSHAGNQMQLVEKPRMTENRHEAEEDRNVSDS